MWFLFLRACKLPGGQTERGLYNLENTKRELVFICMLSCIWTRGKMWDVEWPRFYSHDHLGLWAAQLEIYPRIPTMPSLPHWRRERIWNRTLKRGGECIISKSSKCATYVLNPRNESKSQELNTWLQCVLDQKEIMITRRERIWKTQEEKLSWSQPKRRKCARIKQTWQSLKNN